jgi:hypothetical protein
MSKKLITFSLWGSNPKYCQGAIKNAELRSSFYPEWKARFYAHKDVPAHYINALNNVEGTEVIVESRKPDWTAMFWRFEAISEPDINIMISRDCDSRLNSREMHAVHEFEKSDALFHIMRDHPHHGFNVLGGMFGIKKGLADNMKDLCDQFDQRNCYGTDYKFFDQFIQNISATDIMVHDPFFAKTQFPKPREGYQFVGQVFDENDNTVESHTNALAAYIHENGNSIN